MAPMPLRDRELQVLRSVAELLDEEAPATVLPEHVCAPGLSETQTATSLRRLVNAGYLIETGFMSFAVAEAGIGIDGITDQGRRAVEL